MLKQIEIDFTHTHENNRESLNHLNENRKKFSKQCLLVIDLLNSGEVLTVKGAMIKYNINSLPRRILDIKEKLNIQIPERWNGNFKEWYVIEKIVCV